jgi:hypothetical protein
MFKHTTPSRRAGEFGIRLRATALGSRHEEEEQQQAEEE